MVTQQFFHIRGRSIAASEPDDLRRTPSNQAELGKIGILGDQKEASGAGVTPDCHVVGFAQAQSADVI